MKSFTISAILAFADSAAAACSREGSAKLTFYGCPDSDPPSAKTAYTAAAATTKVVELPPALTTTPLIMASAQGEFSICEIIYVPYLKRHVR